MVWRIRKSSAAAQRDLLRPYNLMSAQDRIIYWGAGDSV